MISLAEDMLLLFARYFPTRRGKLRLVNKLWSKVLWGYDTHRIAHLKYGGLRMECDLSELLQRQFYYFGTYFIEEEIIRCWQCMAKGAKTIFDVGANAGIYSLAALAVERETNVYAFEPTPEIANRLKNTVKLNGLDRLLVYEAAVSSRPGIAYLRRLRGENGINEGMNFVVEANTGDVGEKVQMLSLDQFCRERSIEKIDLLKIDVQGHEYAVLKGAEQLIMAGRIKTIFMELNWDSGCTCECPATKSIEFLEHSQYRFSIPGRYLNWRPAGDWLRSLHDIVARLEST